MHRVCILSLKQAFQRPAAAEGEPGELKPVYEQYLTLKKALATEADATKTPSLLNKTLALTEVGDSPWLSGLSQTHARLDRWV